MAGPFAVVNPTAKSIALQDLPESAWRTLAGTPLDAGLTPAQAYKSVPWVYRGVNIRAQTLANIPCAILRGTDEIWSSEEGAGMPKGLEWLKDIFDLLYRTEQSLSLYASAYWLRKRNRVRTLGFRYLLSSSMRPVIDADQGLTGFKRTIGSQPIPLALDDVAYWWMPSVEAELGPGVSPVHAALQAAGLLKGIDDFGRAFFDRGAINATLLTVEGNPPREELERLERWWRRLLSGVRRAYETAAVRAGVKPVVVGSPPKDLALESLSVAKRLDIATALGVPLSLLEDQSANYATARESTWGFMVFTMLPEAEMIERGLNAQIFNPLGFEFRFKPELLEIMQDRQDEKALKLLASVIGGVVTGNEMRTALGLKELPELDTLRPMPAAVAVPTAPVSGAGPLGTGEHAISRP